MVDIFLQHPIQESPGDSRSLDPFLMSLFMKSDQLGSEVTAPLGQEEVGVSINPSTPKATATLHPLLMGFACEEQHIGRRSEAAAASRVEDWAFLSISPHF